MEILIFIAFVIFVFLPAAVAIWLINNGLIAITCFIYKRLDKIRRRNDYGL